MKKKIIYLTLFLFIITFISYPNQAKTNDIPQYTIDKIQELESKQNHMNLMLVGQLLVKLNRIKEVINLIKLLPDEYYKTALILEFLSMPQQLDSDDFNQIINIEEGIRDTEYRSDIIAEKILFLLKTGKQKNALALLKKLKSHPQNTILENSVYLTTLIKSLNQNGLKKDSENLWNLCWDKSIEDIPFLLALLDCFPHKKMEMSKFKNEIVATIEKSKNIEIQAKRTIKFCEYLINSGMFAEAQKQLVNRVNYLIKISKGHEKPNLINILLNGSDNRFILKILSQIEEFNSQLDQYFHYTEEGRFRYLNKKILNYLIRTGQYEVIEIINGKIKDYSEKNPAIPKEMYHDYIKYFFAKELSRTETNSIKTLKLIFKINDQALKMDLLCNHINSVDKEEEITIFLKIINDLLNIDIKDNLKRDDHWGRLAMICLEKKQEGKAFEIITKVKYPPSKSILLYELAQNYIRGYGTKVINKILTELDLTTDCKAYIFSLMASRLWNDGHKKKAFNYFKKAIDKILISKTGELEIVLSDYFYAIKYQKLVRHKAWGKLNKID